MPRKKREISLRIGEGDKKNFDTLKQAFSDNAVGLIVVFDKKTETEEIAIAAFSKDEKGEIMITPFGLLMRDNPYERLIPPDPKMERSDSNAN